MEQRTPSQPDAACEGANTTRRAPHADAPAHFLIMPQEGIPAYVGAAETSEAAMQTCHIACLPQHALRVPLVHVLKGISLG